MKGMNIFLNLLNYFCEENGIIHQQTAPYTPWQNGVVDMASAYESQVTFYTLGWSFVDYISHL